MKKKILLLLLAVTAYSCDDEGLSSNISKSIEESMVIQASLVDVDLMTFSLEIDPASDEFEQYLDEIEDFYVNKVEIRITELPASGNPVLEQFQFGASASSIEAVNIFSEASDAASPFIDEITNNDGEIFNSAKVLIYEKGTNNGIISDGNAGIENIINALKNATPFNVAVALDFEQDLTTDFRITLFLDLTAVITL